MVKFVKSTKIKDEIDVGTHADSIGFNNSNCSKSNGGGSISSTLSNAINDQNFGAGSSGHHQTQNGLSEVNLD